MAIYIVMPMKYISLFKNRELQAIAVKSWDISWPMIFIMFFEFVINLTDVYIAGKLGREYQAAVGFVSTLYFIFVVIGNALTIGTVAVTARQFASDRQAFADSAWSITVTILVLGGLLGVFGLLFSPLILSIIHIPREVKEVAGPLLEIYAASLVFHYFLINSNGLMRAGDMIRKSMSTMAVTALSNIILNFILVFHTPLGYRGIALSTALSVLLGCILNYLHLGPVLRQKKTFSRENVKRIAVIGWPAVLLRGAWQLGSTVLFLIIGSLPFHSVETLAAFTNGMRIESAIFLPAFAFNMANAVIVGNYLGQKKTDDAFRAGLITAFLSVIVIVILTLLVVLNAGQLSRFLSNDSIVVAESIRYIYISMISEPFMAWAVVLSGGLNGAGDTRSVMIIVVMSLWLVRIPLAYVLGITAGLGAPAIWWAMNASIFLHALFVTRRYLQRNWLYDE